MLPKEVTEFMGKSMDSSIFEVQEEAIRRFADAVDDPNPLYWDEEYAQKSKYGAIIAPPGFISSPWFSNRPTKWPKKDMAPSDATDRLRTTLATAGFGRLLDGGMEYEFFKTVRAGDTVRSSTIIKDIIEREGRIGKMVFIFTETTYTDKSGSMIAKARGTSIYPAG